MKKQDFPIPYPGQMPNDDLACARLMMRSVVFAMEDGEKLPSANVQCLFNVLCVVAEKLEVIQLFLDDCEFPGIGEKYREARRQWIVSNGGSDD